MPAFKITTSPSTLSISKTAFASSVSAGSTNWQAAILNGANNGNSLDFGVLGSYDTTIASTSSSAVQGVAMNGMQIIKVVEFLQPAVMPNTNNDGVPLPMEYTGPDGSGLPSGDYMLLHVHGAINTHSAPPAYAGGWYKLIHSTSSTPVIARVNYPEIGRYDSGQEASAAYSGNKTFFTHAGGNIVLQYVNEGGYYNNITVTQDPRTVSAYITTGVSYPAAITAATDPIAPVFALISLTALNNEVSSVLPPIFIPSTRPYASMSSYNDNAIVWGKGAGQVYYTLTTDGTMPATPTSASTAGAILPAITTIPITLKNTRIKAVVKSGGVYSPVAYAEYL